MPRSRKTKKQPKKLLVRLVENQEKTRAGTIRTRCRAWWTDPDTGKRASKDLTTAEMEAELPDANARKAWALAKHEALAARRQELAKLPQVEGARTIEEAVEKFLAAKAVEVEPITLRQFKLAADDLTRFCEDEGISRTDKLTGPILYDLATFVLGRPRRVPVTNKAIRAGLYEPKDDEDLRGARREITEDEEPDEKKRRRGARTTNKIFFSLKHMLNNWRVRSWVRLTGDEIKDALKRRKELLDSPDILTQAKVRRLLQKVISHDTPKNLRDKKFGNEHKPVGRFVIACLLSGMRFTECADLEWREVLLDLDAPVHERRPRIKLPARRVKTGKGRSISLKESPTLREMLIEMKVSSGCSWGSEKRVFGDLTPQMIIQARTRLIEKFDAPRFTWQMLRRTCGTALTCAPSIYGAASEFLSAKRLGHNVAVAERFYVGRMEISPEAKTIEQALGIEQLIDDLLKLSNTQVGSERRREREAETRRPA